MRVRPKAADAQLGIREPLNRACPPAFHFINIKLVVRFLRPTEARVNSRINLQSHTTHSAQLNEDTTNEDTTKTVEKKPSSRGAVWCCQRGGWWLASTVALSWRAAGRPRQLHPGSRLPQSRRLWSRVHRATVASSSWLSTGSRGGT